MICFQQSQTILYYFQWIANWEQEKKLQKETQTKLFHCYLSFKKQKKTEIVKMENEIKINLK